MTSRLHLVSGVWISLALIACDDVPHDGPDAGTDGGVTACDVPRGALRGQVLPNGDGVEDRVYWLYVPASYRCDPTPLLVDFHGTAGLVPEEAYQTQALITFAEARGVIVARPRSRSYAWNGGQIYQWDGNVGDLERNIELAKRLVTDLGDRYTIDPARTYASGFSSGANMVGQFLSIPDSPFVGLAPIAGGTWAQIALPTLATGPRLYVATGYRDYLWGYARTFAARALASGLPADRLWLRRGGGGHDLYAWHFEELWQFLDEHTRPDQGTLAAPWLAESLPSGADVLALANDGGELVAAGASGRVWRRGASAVWTLELDRGAPDYTTVCFGAAGQGFVGGQYRGAHRSGTTWSANAAVPDHGQLGSGWINGAACRDDGSVVLGGYWSAVITSDGGTSYRQFKIPTKYPGVEAQIAGLAEAPGGATVAVGYYDYVGTAARGTIETELVEHGTSTEWWNAVAAVGGGKFWVVGDDGAIARSSDDGVTWSEQFSGTGENLYAVHFADALHGAAVGRRGAIVVTSDGGAHWTPRPLGKDVFLGAVHVDGTAITAAGEDGLLVTSPR